MSQTATTAAQAAATAPPGVGVASAQARPRGAAWPRAAGDFDAALARRDWPLAPGAGAAAQAPGEAASEGVSRDAADAATLWRRLVSYRLDAGPDRDVPPAASPTAPCDAPPPVPPAQTSPDSAAPPRAVRDDPAPDAARARAPLSPHAVGAPAPARDEAPSQDHAQPRAGFDEAGPSAPSLRDALATNVAPLVETHLPPARWPQAIGAIGEGAAALRPRLAEASDEAAGPAAARVGVLRLALDPERLGAVSVTLRLRGGELEARILAQTGETAALIESRRGELADALRKAGYEIGALHVAHAATDASSARPSEHREQSHAGRPDDDRRQHRDGAAADEQRRPAPRHGRDGESRSGRDAAGRDVARDDVAGFEPG